VFVGAPWGYGYPYWYGYPYAYGYGYPYAYSYPYPYPYPYGYAPGGYYPPASYSDDPPADHSYDAPPANYSSSAPATAPARPARPAYVERSPAMAVSASKAPPPLNWYYCASAKAYYPTVKNCHEAWIKVPPLPW
jgi:hypothetical protein